MKIENLHIQAFGKLHDKNIEFTDGINVITGSNESGKSTVLSYISAMLFGMKKSVKHNIQDSQRYEPWANTMYGGTLTYSLDHTGKYTVQRAFDKKTFQIFDDTMKDVTKLYVNRKNYDDYLSNQIDVDKDVFRSTAFSLQNMIILAEDQKQQMIQKMTNVITSGDENVSFNNIIKSLSAKQIEEVGNSRTKNRPYNDIENNINIYEKQLYELQNINNKESFSYKQRENLQNELEKVRIKKELIDKVYSKQIEISTHEKDLQEVKLEIAQKKNEIYEKKNSKIDVTSSKNVFKNNILLNSIILGVALVITGLFFTFDFLLKIKMIEVLWKEFRALNLPNWIDYIIYSIPLILAVILISIIYVHKKMKFTHKEMEDSKINRDIEKEINILRKDVLTAEKELEKRLHESSEESKKEIEQTCKEYIDLIEKDEVEKIYKYDPEKLLAKRKELEKEYERILFEISKLNTQKTILENNNEKLTQTISTLDSYYKKRQTLAKYNDSFELAKELLQEAYVNLKKNIGPSFNKELSKITSQLTGGKYSNVTVNADYQVTVQNSLGNYVDLYNLSDGTIEQINLALRLALLTSIAQERLPIILDEAFVYCDNKRLENMLKYLHENYSQNQIILTSCTDREVDMLDKLNIKYNLIQL